MAEEARSAGGAPLFPGDGMTVLGYCEKCREQKLIDEHGWCRGCNDELFGWMVMSAPNSDDSLESTNPFGDVSPVFIDDDNDPRNQPFRRKTVMEIWVENSEAHMRLEKNHLTQLHLFTEKF